MPLSDMGPRMTSTRQIIRIIQADRKLEYGIADALQESLRIKRLAVKLAPLPTAEVIQFPKRRRAA